MLRRGYDALVLRLLRCSRHRLPAGSSCSGVLLLLGVSWGFISFRLKAPSADAELAVRVRPTMRPSTRACNPSNVMARSVDGDVQAHTLVWVQPHPWTIRHGLLSEPMRRPAGSCPHVEDMRYPSESRYGLLERLVGLCDDVDLLAEGCDADALRRLLAPPPAALCATSLAKACSRAGLHIAK